MGGLIKPLNQKGFSRLSDLGIRLAPKKRLETAPERVGDGISDNELLNKGAFAG